jgi:hypothetical protein
LQSIRCTDAKDIFGQAVAIVKSVGVQKIKERKICTSDEAVLVLMIRGRSKTLLLRENYWEVKLFA